MRKNKPMYLNTGSRRKNRVDKKRLTGLVIGVGALVAVGFAFMPNAYEVTVKGQVVGALEKKEYVTTAVDTVKSQLEHTYNTNVTLEGIDKVKWVHASKKEMITPEYLASYVREHGDVELELRALKIDGKQVAIVKSDETVEELRKALTEEYYKDANLKSQFVKSVTTEKVMATEADLIDFDDLVDQCTDTTKEKVTYVVEAGDSLSKIAGKLKITVASLISANEGMTETTPLQIGQALKAEVKVPLLGIELLVEEQPKEEKPEEVKQP
ncbi:MAG: LysM peptidoglycan-binding domain-containing protein [Cellulosilyticaceae bacterium]